MIDIPKIRFFYLQKQFPYFLCKYFSTPIIYKRKIYDIFSFFLKKMVTSSGFQNISFHNYYVFTFPFKGSVWLDLVVELRVQYYGDKF